MSLSLSQLDRHIDGEVTSNSVTSKVTELSLSLGLGLSCRGIMEMAWFLHFIHNKHTCSVQSLSRVRLFATPWIAARQACLSPTPGVYSNSCPSSRWCHPAISSSVFPFSCPQALPASGSFPMNQLFAWGGQSTGVSPLTFWSSVISLCLTQVLVAQSCPTLCNPMDCSLPRLLCLWNSPGKNIGGGSHSLLQGIF